ncbi:MAG: DUF2029 domain-containing protein [Chloroflexi bacterium]|nr:DUF2029 domain-containing protein [Chloroflexota bacterium]
MVLYLGAAGAIYQVYTARIPSGNDFYSRWFGARTLLLEGRNPYSAEVTRDIQLGMYGRLARPDEDQVAFAYPLYVALLIAPLVGFPYPQAQALWSAALLFTTVASVLLSLSWVGWRPSRLGSILLVLWALFLYPIARSLILGQFSLLVLALLVTALWAFRTQREGWAGIALAGATLKPQMVFLLIPLLLAWAVGTRRWRVILGFLGAITVLIALPWLWLPGWPVPFLAGLPEYQRYSGAYTGSLSPLALTLAPLPSELQGPLVFLLGLALLGATLWAWYRLWRDKAVDLYWPLGLAILATLLVPMQSGTTNQVLLLLPLLSVFHEWNRRGTASSDLTSRVLRKGRGWLPVVALFLLLAPWALFLATVKGDAEQAIMFLPLPWLTLVLAILSRPGGQ